MTVDAPHINRASMMIPPLALISGLGFSQIANHFKGRTSFIITALVTIIGLFSALYTLNLIFIHKPVFQPWYSETVNKQLVEDITLMQDKYREIAISKDEFIFFLFYNRISPKEFINRADILPLTQTNPWDRVNRLDNIYFNMPSDCPLNGKLDVLYVCRGQDIPQNSRVLKVIRYLDRIPAYTFIQFYPISKMPNILPELPEGLKYRTGIGQNPEFPDGIIPESFPKL